ncbi:MAG: low temperature requirement protein A [Solirubrobacteraceae bacterium]
MAGGTEAAPAAAARPGWSRHLRVRDPDGEQQTTNLELFFDLVFVFAITQLSHHLLGALTWAGAAQTGFLLLVVWWAWIYTTWMTNWFDPDSVTVRVVLIGVMGASMVMAIAIPDAFGDRAILFAGAYVALQVGRNLFNVWATRHDGSSLARTFQRILVWSLASGALWIAGGLASEDLRIGLWIAALAIDYGGPALLYWTPGLGRSAYDDWQIDGAQFAERFQLFVIISLGETIVVTGATASEKVLDAGVVAAMLVAFLGTAALWWIYFDYVAGLSQRHLSETRDRGRLARDGFTYGHIPIVAGIIVAAVGDEVVIAHATAHLHAAELAAVAGGPALYLLGHAAFRWSMVRSVGWSRLVGAAIIAAIGVAGLAFPALAVASAIVVVLAVLAAWPRIRRRRASGAPAAG